MAAVTTVADNGTSAALPSTASSSAVNGRCCSPCGTSSVPPVGDSSASTCASKAVASPDCTRRSLRRAATWVSMRGSSSSGCAGMASATTW
ncbi:Uncharacterised protein [Mycobacteroides abscessus subsp. abscessus]|nr:Uncharacterised protein [Mycobacteroides abscessus subsp. abscessus]